MSPFLRPVRANSRGCCADKMSEHDFMRDECGVFGVYAPGEDVARLTFFGLFALQHRGQESAGIAVSDGERMLHRKGMGLAQNVFDEDVLSDLKGICAIGQVRYSTTGASNIRNAQPMLVEGKRGPVALAHNGNLVNAAELRAELESDGAKFESTSDSEVIVRLVARLMDSDPARFSLEEAVAEAMRCLRGAYSAVLLHRDALVGMRDPWGVRPLCVGGVNGGYVIASETCAFSVVGAKVEREIEPGEIVVIRKGEVRSMTGLEGRKGGKCTEFAASLKPAEEWPTPDSAFCIFEYVYLGRPDSVMLGRNLDVTRRRMGNILAQERPVAGDVVVPVPNTGTPGALGFAEASHIPLSTGLIKNQYIQRTFIEPDQRMREMGVRMKLSPIPDLLAGRRVVLVDDSIVRGTTTGHLVRMVRDAGAREVHLRICSPPIGYPCYYGVDTAIQEELIAYRMKVPEIREAVGADSLGYLSISGLVKAIDLPRNRLCLACLNGKYPIGLPSEVRIRRAMFETGSKAEVATGKRG